jgi:hypothetical protein
MAATELICFRYPAQATPGVDVAFPLDTLPLLDHCPAFRLPPHGFACLICLQPVTSPYTRNDPVNPALLAGARKCPMQKAHLYEAILLVNRGIDEAVRGLERLMGLKNSRLDSAVFGEGLALFEQQRTWLNVYFCNNIENGEELDAALFEKRYGEYRAAMLDEAQVYRDVQAIEGLRRSSGKPSRVRFLTNQEQCEWERPSSEPTATAEAGRQ